MPYRIADMNNGPFSESLETYAEAEELLEECVQEGKEMNLEMHDSELGSDGSSVEDFYAIIDTDTGVEAQENV